MRIEPGCTVQQLAKKASSIHAITLQHVVPVRLHHVTSSQLLKMSNDSDEQGIPQYYSHDYEHDYIMVWPKPAMAMDAVVEYHPPKEVQ